MTAGEIARAIKEAAESLEGAFLQKITQTGAEEWAFELRKGADRLWLLISVSPRNGRIHLTQDAPEETIPMEGFARNLKKTILRRKILTVRQMAGDRVAHIVFGGGGGEMTLAVEIMGTSGNVFLLDHEGKVGAMALARKSRNELGGAYLPPEPHAQTTPAKPSSPVEIDPAEPFPFNFAIERRSAASAMEEKLATAKARATAPIREELKKLERHGKNLEEELVSLKGFAGYRKLADLIMANYHLIAKGSDKLETADLFSPGMEMIIIPLDPAKSVEKNAEAYYKKHRKFEKGSPRIETDVASMAQKRAALRARMEKAQSALSIADLAQFLPREPEGGDRPVRKKAEKKEKQATGPKRFISSEGHLILVGRNDQENDELTFKIANGRDLWLHARDYPGSHVLVRMPKGVEPTRRTIEEAAMIALNYSKAAKAGKGEVTYTHAKNVKKPKGAPPGKAQVHGEKSIMARIDETAIKAMREK
jgi:predicted ribosome quality control (RQC) complex YloA/Tae2 family protein